MKYLGILKDSFREAIDTKVFYATLAISCLLVLLIGSVRFRPVPAEEQFRRSARLLTFFLNINPQGKDTRFDIADFEQTNDAAEPWNGDYRFIYYIEFPIEVSAEQARQFKASYSATMIRNLLEQQFPWIQELSVSDSPADTTRTIRYQVVTRGTKVKDRRGWPHDPALFFGAVPLTFLHFVSSGQLTLAGAVSFIADKLIGKFGAAITMLLSTVITAFFIPNMLRKGTIDLLLAKPIHRGTLLIYKCIGGMTFMFLNTLVVLVGIWLALGLQTGLWLNGLLLCIFVFTFQFAIFYSVSTLSAVLTRSPIVAILAASLTWAVLFLIGWGYFFIDAVRPEKVAGKPRGEVVQLPRWVFLTADALHFVAPHYKDLDVLTTQLINRDLHDPDSDQRRRLDDSVGSINWTESLGVTIAFIVGVLGLACWWFARKDY